AGVYWIAQAPALPGMVLPAAATLLLGGLVLGAAAVLARPRLVLAGLALMGIPLLALVMRAQAEVAPMFSWKALSSQIVAQVPRSVEIVFEAPEEYQQVGGLAFYTGRRIT